MKRPFGGEKIEIKNDYNQHFLDTGERPQNFIRDGEAKDRFADYPKLERLLALKDDVCQKRATPYCSITADLKTFDLTALGSRFDVILVDPPWQEYSDRVPVSLVPSEDLTPWTQAELLNLRVDLVAENPSFCWIWAANNHLEDARELLRHWGFRRCEDIGWLKTNKRESKRRKQKELETGETYTHAGGLHSEHSILQRTKEHCLMGIKGTVKRSTDGHFIHANVDTDILVDEEPEELGSTAKPKELYDIIEHFCLGRRRLELFGTDRNIRMGWVTIGNAITHTSNFDPDTYRTFFEGDAVYPDVQDARGGRYLGSTPEIDALRPKSPPRGGGGGGGSLNPPPAPAAPAVNPSVPSPSPPSGSQQGGDTRQPSPQPPPPPQHLPLHHRVVEGPQRASTPHPRDE